MQGNIALEEHFILPSFGAYGADASVLAPIMQRFDGNAVHASAPA